MDTARTATGPQGTSRHNTGGSKTAADMGPQTQTDGQTVMKDLETRLAGRLRRLFAPVGDSPVATVCADLDLVVALQRCARSQPARLAELLVRHGRMLDLWLFGVALSCAGLGLVEEADLLLDAVPGVQAAACGRRALLQELVRFGADGQCPGSEGRAA